jgi:hypothetical protein
MTGTAWEQFSMKASNDMAKLAQVEMVVSSASSDSWITGLVKDCNKAARAAENGDLQ